MKRIILVFSFSLFLFQGLLFAQDTISKVATVNDSTAQFGKATFYSDRMHGRRTFSGERYSKFKFTAAHATLPMGTLVKVTNLKNDKFVVVKIIDRCAKRKTMVIDLSKIAAKELGFISNGIANVKLELAVPVKVAINTKEGESALKLDEQKGN